MPAVDRLIISLTRQEASALSLAAIFGGPAGQRYPALESGRKKLREALDGEKNDEGQRYVALEC
jgi:hypothetical protein